MRLSGSLRRCSTHPAQAAHLWPHPRRVWHPPSSPGHDVYQRQLSRRALSPRPRPCSGQVVGNFLRKLLTTSLHWMICSKWTLREDTQGYSNFLGKLARKGSKSPLRTFPCEPNAHPIRISRSEPPLSKTLPAMVCIRNLIPQKNGLKPPRDYVIIKL